MTELTHLSLFSGIGGLDLAAEWAGFRTVGQCEWADYPTKVLEKHWPDVPRWKDIRTLTGSDFYERTGLQTVDIISGGFPCQPFSVAGKRRGKEDDRYLWPEMLRIISEIRPAWVLGENVPGIINLALDTVLSSLEGEGYACQTFVVPAAGVDAPHRRERIAIVAYSDRNRRAREFGKSSEGGRNPDQINPAVAESSAFPNADCDGGVARRTESEGQQREARITDGGYDVANTESAGFQGHYDIAAVETNGFGEGQPFATSGEDDVSNPESIENRRVFKCRPQSDIGTGDNGHSKRSRLSRDVWWSVEPDVGRGFDGLSAILDGIGGLSDAAKNRSCEILRDVREDFTPEAIQRAFGGFQGISAEEILLAFLCEYEEKCFRSGASETSGTIPEGLLRGLWRTVESARASYRREYYSQLAREYSDALLRLPHGTPSLMPQAWANGAWENGIKRVTHGVKNRVDRLKCLGNAVVPQQFYPFFKWIAEIERK